MLGIHKICAFVVTMFASMFLYSCGDTVEVVEAVGNAALVFESKTASAVTGQDITINRIRVWKSNSNTSAPGNAALVDQYTVELWGTLSGESASRYAKFTGLLADSSGNLYMDGAEPGKITYNPLSSRNLGATVPSYTIVATDALISSEYPAYLVYENTVVTNSGADSVTTTTLIDPADTTTISESPWSTIKQRSLSVSSAFFRTRYEENAAYTTVAKLGCFLRLTDADGNRGNPSYVFGDVELGNVLGDKTGVTDVGGGTDDTTGDDDTLWITWSENWYVTNINVSTKKIRMFRARSAPFYGARELPGIDTTDEAPKPSGIEKLVRSCNSASTRTGSTFSFFSLTGSAVSPSVASVNNTHGYCQDLVDTLDTDEKTLALNTSSYGTCSWGGLGVSAGTWNGSTAHTGPITTANSNKTHIEQTAIVEVAF